MQAERGGRGRSEGREQEGRRPRPCEEKGGEYAPVEPMQRKRGVARPMMPPTSGPVLMPAWSCRFTPNAAATAGGTLSRGKEAHGGSDEPT